jgi:hypothetical protein
MKIYLAAFLTLLAAAALGSEKISVEVNGKPLKLETAPMLRNGEAWVPVREITEALGGHLQVIRPNKLLGICLGKKCVPLRVGTRDAIIVNGRTMSPAKKMADALEARMKWDKGKNLLQFFVDRPLPDKDKGEKK